MAEYIPLDLAEKLAAVFSGRGQPSIVEEAGQQIRELPDAARKEMIAGLELVLKSAVEALPKHPHCENR